MRSTITEKDIKQTFGIRVKMPVGFINYRDYEISVKGIDEELKRESFMGRRKRLLKIRDQMRKVLNEL